MAPSQAAVARFRSQLHAMGITDDASIRHLALTEAGLRAVAPEVIGVFCTLAADDATKGMDGADTWAALVSVWRQSAFGADRWTAEHGRRLSAPPSCCPSSPSTRVPAVVYSWCQRLPPLPAPLLR